ncbi:MAG: hypothetical protein ACNI3C_05205 [Candidatus Marinarcus sp.]|uniref:hypothetical protein n=1 Tax=Candidatus Marinarcus sp. TaxID=3100987 RepID=UPI003B0010D4
MDELKKYCINHDILHEYIYERSPEIVASFIKNKLMDKKILFYGDGGHSLEVISLLNSHLNILGVIETLNKDEYFNNSDFGSLPIYKICDIKNLTFDFIIVLGYWTEKLLNEFIEKNNLPLNKVLNIYKEKDIQKLNKEKLLKQIRKNFITNEKKSLAIILRWDNRDPITMSSFELSKEYRLTKIYLTSNNIEEENQFFDNVICCNNNGSYYELLLEELEFDVVIFNNVDTRGINLAYYSMLKIKTKNRSKFFFTTTEDSFGYLTPFTNEDYKGMIIGIDDEYVECSKKSYLSILSDGDGYITNITGPILNKIKKVCFNPLFYMHFVEEKYFIDSSNIDYDSNLKFVFTGAVRVLEKNDHRVLQGQDLFKVFSKLTEYLDCSVDVWSSQFIAEQTKNDLYVNNNIYIHDFIVHSKIVETISSYHFGVISRSFDMTDDVAELFREHDKSHIFAKFMTYIAAGLPIIVQDRCSAISNIVEKYNIGIVFKMENISNLKNIINNINYGQMRKNVRSFQLYYLNSNPPLQLKNYLLNNRK